jgi:hypothetical protein
MKKTRTIRIVVEREREMLIRRRPSQETWCPSCGAQAQLLTIAEAARFAGLTELALHQLLEVRTIHLAKTADGRTLICFNSLTHHNA